MKETLVHRIKEITLKDPILVEGLPGVGHVGKLVADHMVEELKAEKIIEIYSPHFPAPGDGKRGWHHQAGPK